MCHKMGQGSRVPTSKSVRLNKKTFIAWKAPQNSPSVLRRHSVYGPRKQREDLGKRRRLPARVPKSIERMLADNPQRQDAIRAMWFSYQIAGDLRRAFNPTC